MGFIVWLTMLLHLDSRKKGKTLCCNGDNTAVHHIYDVMHDLYDGFVYNIFLNISGERVQNFSHFSKVLE